jgi:hypothetical protein
MTVNQTTKLVGRRRRFTKDVNGLFLVVGVLAVLMISLPCPSDASIDHADGAREEAPFSATIR